MAICFNKAKTHLVKMRLFRPNYPPDECRKSIFIRMMLGVFLSCRPILGRLPLSFFSITGDKTHDKREYHAVNN
jgi:hypothetical protein